MKRKKEELKEIESWEEKDRSRYMEKIKELKSGKWKKIKEYIQEAIQRRWIKIKGGEKENKWYDKECKDKKKEVIEGIKKRERRRNR